MIVDGVFGFMLLLGAWHGLRSGFARILLNLTCLLLASVFAEPISKFASDQFSAQFESIPAAIRPSLVFLGSIVAVWFLCWTCGSMFLAWYRRRLFGENVPSLPDRVLGMGLGMAEAAMLIGLAVHYWPMVPGLIREAEPVKAQFDASKGVKLAHEYPFAERVIDLPEVRKVKEHLLAVLEHYRQPTKTASKEDLDLPPLR